MVRVREICEGIIILGVITFIGRLIGLGIKGIVAVAGIGVIIGVVVISKRKSKRLEEEATRLHIEAEKEKERLRIEAEERQKEAEKQFNVVCSIYDRVGDNESLRKAKINYHFSWIFCMDEARKAGLYDLEKKLKNAKEADEDRPARLLWGTASTDLREFLEELKKKLEVEINS